MANYHNYFAIVRAIIGGLLHGPYLECFSGISSGPRLNRRRRSGSVGRTPCPFAITNKSLCNVHDMPRKQRRQ